MLEAEKKIGDYILVEYIDSGGFGEVWKAEKRTDWWTTEFAVKFFRPKNAQDINLEKVRKEIAVWKEVSGAANIISVVEAGEFEKYIYIVSEYADGGTLENLLSENGGRAESAEEAVRIILEILAGLERMHGAGFVHRDVKPANILIRKNVFCLADFGISRQMKAQSKATGRAGTYEYMPPEAFYDNPSIGVHTDVWAAGLILQEMLTGEFPFSGDRETSLIRAILQDEPKAMPDEIPELLREIVKKALQKNREDRFTSVAEMHAALKKVEWRKAGKQTIDDDGFNGRQEFDDIIRWVQELARNPKDIKPALKKLSGVSSFDDLKKLRDELRFAAANQTVKPKIKFSRRIMISAGIGATAVLGMIITFAILLAQTSRTSLKTDDLPNQAANVQVIVAEKADQKSVEVSTDSSISIPIPPPVNAPNVNKRTISRIANTTASPTAKIELPTPTNSTKTPEKPVESPTPTPKPPAAPKSSVKPTKTPKPKKPPVNLDCKILGICH